MLTDDERLVRKRAMTDFEWYAPRVLKIRSKAGKVEPLRLNKAQLALHEALEAQRAATGRVRALVLKGRQQGVSTYTAARYYWRVTHQIGYRVYVLTHEAEATDNLFTIAKRYHEQAPEWLRPATGADSRRELEFPELDGGYKVGTAGNRGAGRSSTVQLFHGSECAFWPHAAEHARGVLQAVPDAPGTEVILESTANGIGNYFHEQWQQAEAGLSEFIAVFLPWFWQPEYVKTPAPGFRRTDEEDMLGRMYDLTDEQLAWRRAKVVELSAGGADGVLGFKQEYPCNAAEAFISSGGEYAFIRPELVMPARKPKEPVEPFGSLVVGVDPARFGDDRTGIIRRRGRVAFGAQALVKLDTMSVTGQVVRIIREERPARIFIDVGGLGAGIVDRLRELGFGELIVAVNSSEKPLDQDRYVNRRAEMWGEMRAWLDDGPVQIPDRDDLHADLCGPMHSYDSKGRIQLEKKEDMKRRGIRSPDLGDALALTFSTSVPMSDYVRIEMEDLPTY